MRRLGRVEKLTLLLEEFVKWANVVLTRPAMTTGESGGGTMTGKIGGE